LPLSFDDPLNIFLGGDAKARFNGRMAIFYHGYILAYQEVETHLTYDVQTLLDTFSPLLGYRQTLEETDGTSHPECS
jgi:hypothetical protein